MCDTDNAEIEQFFNTILNRYVENIKIYEIIIIIMEHLNCKLGQGNRKSFACFNDVLFTQLNIDELNILKL